MMPLMMPRVSFLDENFQSARAYVGGQLHILGHRRELDVDRLPCVEARHLSDHWRSLHFARRNSRRIAVRNDRHMIRSCIKED
jgi:hypothetical protein